MLKKPALKLNYFIFQENSDLMKQLERRSEELQDARDQAELLEFRVLELEEERDKVYITIPRFFWRYPMLVLVYPPVPWVCLHNARKTLISVMRVFFVESC